MADNDSGMTLVEMLTVVVIIGVLTVVAASTYTRYSIKSKKTEVVTVFAEIRLKQEAYRNEQGTYVDLGNGSDTALHPALLTAPKAEPVQKSWGSSGGVTPPTSWTTLGISITMRGLYCSYGGRSGAAGTAPAGRSGSILGTAVQPQAWWTAWAACDWDGAPEVTNSHETASDRMSDFETNETN
jgi:prepilin-type N-terminal cleavage/methylation domain-containing protein